MIRPNIFKYLFLTTLAFVSVILVSCYYDSEEDMYGICQSGAGDFVADVLPIVETHCNGITCHNAGDKGGGIILESHSQIAEAAAKGSFMGSIRHESNFKVMPLNAPQLDTCTINTLSKWIERGMLNN